MHQKLVEIGDNFELNGNEQIDQKFQEKSQYQQNLLGGQDIYQKFNRPKFSQYFLTIPSIIYLIFSFFTLIRIILLANLPQLWKTRPGLQYFQIIFYIISLIMLAIYYSFLKPKGEKLKVFIISLFQMHIAYSQYIQQKEGRICDVELRYAIQLSSLFIIFPQSLLNSYIIQNKLNLTDLMQILISSLMIILLLLGTLCFIIYWIIELFNVNVREDEEKPILIRKMNFHLNREESAIIILVLFFMIGCFLPIIFLTPQIGIIIDGLILDIFNIQQPQWLQLGTFLFIAISLFQYMLVQFFTIKNKSKEEKYYLRHNLLNETDFFIYSIKIFSNLAVILRNQIWKAIYWDQSRSQRYLLRDKISLLILQISTLLWSILVGAIFAYTSIYQSRKFQVQQLYMSYSYFFFGSMVGFYFIFILKQFKCCQSEQEIQWNQNQYVMDIISKRFGLDNLLQIYNGKSNPYILGDFFFQEGYYKILIHLKELDNWNQRQLYKNPNANICRYAIIKDSRRIKEYIFDSKTHYHLNITPNVQTKKLAQCIIGLKTINYIKMQFHRRGINSMFIWVEKLQEFMNEIFIKSNSFRVKFLEFDKIFLQNTEIAQFGRLMAVFIVKFKKNILSIKMHPQQRNYILNQLSSPSNKLIKLILKASEFRKQFFQFQMAVKTFIISKSKGNFARKNDIALEIISLLDIKF